jgi:hypothetical protein
MSRFGESSVLAAVLCFGVAGAQQQRPPINLVSVGPPRLIYDTGRDGCTQWDYPDASARAFRDGLGTIHFLMTTSTNRAMLGQDFAHLKRRAMSPTKVRRTIIRLRTTIMAGCRRFMPRETMFGR